VARTGADGDTLETLSDEVAVVDGNVDTLVTRVPAEVAQKAHLVNGAGDITPPTDKGIWDALGDGSKSISGLNDVSAADVNAQCDTALADYDAVVPADLNDPTANDIRDAILDDATRFSGADIAAILTDTNELQSDNVPSLIAALNDLSATDVRNAVIADGDGTEINAANLNTLSGHDPGSTIAAQSDVTGLNDISAADVDAEVDEAIENYGLDHLVSAAVSGTDITDDSIIAKLVSKAATADWDDFDNTTEALQALRDHIGDGTNLTEAGGDGDHLTAVPWNSNWDSEVQSEVDDALRALHLDHLLAANYDPASQPGVATALLNELIESDGGVSRFTANALEAITDDDMQIDASALNTLSGHDPGSQLAAQTDVTGLNDLSASDVNDQMLDVLDTDTFTELTGVPSDDATLTQMIRWVYLLARNKITQTSTTQSVKADDGSTEVASATVSDDGVTFERGEFG
jgi:hypothetical protein